MAKTKISEFNANPALNTDIDSINIAEGCAPSGINDAIRELMSQLKDWQAGTSNDPMVIGSSGSLTLNQGTANGVAYLNGSKVVTSGSALTFDGTNWKLGNPTTVSGYKAQIYGDLLLSSGAFGSGQTYTISLGDGNAFMQSENGQPVAFGAYNGFKWGFASTDNKTISSEWMRLTSTGLGIGTSSPAYKLDVSKSATGLLARFTGLNNAVAVYTDSTLGGFSDSTGQYGLFNVYSAGSATATTIWTANAERLRVDSSGNLGLGVTPSAWSTAGNIQLPSLTLAGQDYSIGSNYYQSGGSRYISTARSCRLSFYDGQFAFLQAPSGTAGTVMSATQAMTLDASGNLGIGTTTPYSKLDLGSYGSNSQLSWHQDSTTSYGTFAIQNSSAAVGLMAGLKMGSSSNSFASSISGLWAKSAILLDYGNIKFFTNTADTVSYGTTYTPTERARIDSSGNLLVGTTSSSGASGAPHRIGVVYNTSTSWALATKTYDRGWVNNQTNSTGGIAAYFEVGSGGTNVGAINTTATSTSYATSSDYRLKNTIAPMTGALAKVAALKPVTYKWNVDGSDGEGFIAHELAEVIPQCVTGEKDAVDENGNPKYQGIDTSFLVATLTAAIQELKAEFDAYKASHP